MFLDLFVCILAGARVEGNLLFKVGTLRLK